MRLNEGKQPCTFVSSPEKANIPSGHPCVHSHIVVPGCCQWNASLLAKQRLHKTIPRKVFQNFKFGLNRRQGKCQRTHTCTPLSFFTTFIVPLYISGSYSTANLTSLLLNSITQHSSIKLI